MEIKFQVFKTARGYFLTADIPEDMEDIPVRELIEASLKKWETIVNWLQENPGLVLWDGGASTCPLCARFSNCEDCPIAKTASDFCEGTPYQDYLEARSRRDAAKASASAKAEVKFLRELLKNYQPKRRGCNEKDAKVR